uniref:Immunoglobulin domain-containing protein n=1 Tax=Cyprinus carpio carpio TaxID=630221 RepID=A0A9J8BHZ0_CYPCA
MEKVSVKEGDSLTLHTDVTEIQRIFFLMWMYGSQNIIIAKIDGKTQTVSLYDVDDGRFEDRLQLDNKTGSLSISDIRTKHSGDYHLKIISNETFLKTFSVTVHDVIFAGLENKKEGDSVTLHTGVTDSQKHDLIQWTFGPTNPDSLVAEMNIKIHEITLNSDDIYRGRFHLENQTGSLTIRDIRTSDAGVYQLQISNSKETLYKRFSVFVAVPDPGLSIGYIVLICLCVPLLVAVALGVMCYMLKYSKKRKEKKMMSVSEGNSITLNTGATEIQRDNEVLWMFGPQDTVIAQIYKKAGNISYTDDERFRDKLQLDHQTGDLTISDIRIPISGDYQMKITGSKAKNKRFKVIVREDTQKITEGEPVHLQTGVTELQEDEEILWMFEDAIIATVNRKSSDNSIYNVNNGKFKRRLRLDEQTGDLTIMNTKSTDSGVYELQIKSSNEVSYKKFNVLVCLNMLKHTVGDSVTLQTDVPELRNDGRILWKFSDKDILIAELNRANNQTLFYEGPDGRFRDRLQLNQQTGDLTIRNISRVHSDVYTLQITSGKKSTCKRFMVIVHEKTVSGVEGDSVTLNTDIEIQEDDLVLWMFGPEDCPIAKGETKEKISTYDYADGRFRGKLNLNYESGSLTITNTRTEHTGVYKLQVICSRETKYKTFRLTIRESERNTGFGPGQEGIPLVQK